MQSDELFIDHGEHRGPDQTGSKQHDAPSSNPQNGQYKHDTGLPPMQTVVQLNVYRDAYGRYEYLLLKRIDEDDKFWQVVTEPVAGSSSLIDALRDAAGEQIGVHGFKELDHDLYSYEWYAGGERGKDIVFAAEVRPETPISIDRSRYSEYAWLPFEEAVQHLKWDGNKQALRKLNSRLHVKRLHMPATITTGFYGNGSNRVINPATDAPATAEHAAAKTGPATAATGAAANRHNPYGDNVPKRLPDVPEEGVDELKPYPDEDDERTGEWFL